MTSSGLHMAVSRHISAACTDTMQPRDEAAEGLNVPAPVWCKGWWGKRSVLEVICKLYSYRERSNAMEPDY